MPFDGAGAGRDGGGTPAEGWRGGLAWLALGLALGAAGAWVFTSVLAPRSSLAGGAAAVEPAPAAGAEAPATSPAVECDLGVVLAQEAVDVAAEIDGHLESVAVRVGETVARGALVARLDTRLLRHRQAIEEAALANAEAERRKNALAAERARQELERRRALGDLVSTQDLETAEFEERRAKADLEAAEASVEQARARVAELTATLAQAEVRAPFDGIVAQRYLDAGSRVAAGTRVLRLISSSDLLVRFAVAPERAERLVPGTPVRVEVETLGRAFAAAVRHRAPEIDAASQMVFVEASLEAPDVAIPSGAVARVTPRPAGAPEPPSCLKAGDGPGAPAR